MPKARSLTPLQMQVANMKPEEKWELLNFLADRMAMEDSFEVEQDEENQITFQRSPSYRVTMVIKISPGSEFVTDELIDEIQETMERMSDIDDCEIEEMNLA